MKDWRYRLQIDGCRAVKSAEITLSEITVLAGVNASGKSTIARIFRDAIEVSANYERLLAERIWTRAMDEWLYFMGNTWRRYCSYFIEREDATPRILRSRRIQKKLLRGEMDFRSAIDEAVAALTMLVSSVAQSENASIRRAMDSFKRHFSVGGDDSRILDKFKKTTTAALELYQRSLSRRTSNSYHELLPGRALFEGRVSLLEGDALVFSSDDASYLFDEITWLKRAIYIESPFKSLPADSAEDELQIGDDDFVRIHRDGEPYLLPDESLFQVLSGGIDYKEDESEFFLGDGRWVYRRNDDAEFDLDECATGIKAISILNILFKRKWLNSETLLIIDEPEAHLHPQWIVEYAKILLLLASRFKVRLLLASHSPDMINALHTIGASMGLSDVMNFYLAEEDSSEKFRFNYRALGCKVGDIFKAYNVSFSKIDEYSRKA